MSFSSPSVDPVHICGGDGSEGEAIASRKVLLFESLIPLLVPVKEAAQHQPTSLSFIPGCQRDGVRVVKRARVSLAFPRETVLQRRDHRRELERQPCEEKSS